VKPIICPVAGNICFSNSACQPLVRRHTPIFQNQRHKYSGSCVHEQTRTRHDRNAKKALLRCINLLVCGIVSGSTSSDLFCNFCKIVPRHLEQKWKKCVLFSIRRIISLQPIISCKENQIYTSFVLTRDNRSDRNVTNQAEQNCECAAPNKMDPFGTP
jgi:hypothetical protein